MESDTHYSKELINILNELGMLSPLSIMRRYKITWECAMKILNEIVEDHMNVYFYNEAVIVIDGREPAKIQKPIKN